MSTLIVLGNTNQFTFANSIMAANNKAVELFPGEPLRDIFIIHSTGSYITLTQKQTEWMGHLKVKNINLEAMTHRIVDVDSTKESVEKFVHYIEFLLKGISSGDPHLIIDLTNSTSLYKNLLSTTTYILDLGHQYLLDTVRLSALAKERGIEGPLGFLPVDMLRASYVPVPNAIQLDNIAYLNLAEMVRYKRIIEEDTKRYVQIDTVTSDKELFEGNLTHSIQLKLQGDRIKLQENRKRDNAIYRIAASSIAASTENLISILIDKFALKDNSTRETKLTFGYKLGLIERRIAERMPGDFDFEFLKKFNDFILYLRNTSTHKSTILADIERLKADLSVKVSFPFIEFYNDIVYPILRKSYAEHIDKDAISTYPEKIKKLSGSDVKAGDVFYFGLDGDDTGSRFEELFLSEYDESKFKRTSDSITNAIRKLSKSIPDNFSRGTIIFATGDNILFKGGFNEPGLHKLQEMYSETTEGLTCSIGYGKSFREAFLALKLAKVEPGKNSIVGIELL